MMTPFCWTSDIVAVFEVQTPIDEHGVALSIEAPESYGYHCKNCDGGFTDWAGCLSHILRREFTANDIEYAESEIRQAEIDQAAAEEKARLEAEALANQPPPEPAPVAEEPSPRSDPPVQ